MLLRTGCVLLVVLACGGIAAGADLELIPKGHPKERPVQTTPIVPQSPAAPSLPAPSSQPPAQQPTPKTETPAQPTPPVPAPTQTTPQRLQSPSAPDDKATHAPSDDKRLNDLQPPALPAPSEGESWWQKVVRSAPNCRTFTDGCRTCDAKFVCSSMPIACQPKEFVCTDPSTPQPSK